MGFIPVRTIFFQTSIFYVNFSFCFMYEDFFSFTTYTTFISIVLRIWIFYLLEYLLFYEWFFLDLGPCTNLYFVCSCFGFWKWRSRCVLFFFNLLSYLWIFFLLFHLWRFFSFLPHIQLLSDVLYVWIFYLLEPPLVLWMIFFRFWATYKSFCVCLLIGFYKWNLLTLHSYLNFFLLFTMKLVVWMFNLLCILVYDYWWKQCCYLRHVYETIYGCVPYECFIVYVYAYDAVDENSAACCFSEEKLFAADDEEF